ncbi:Rad17-domain-containing protein [Hymenopellis radicata]|nr:Rad17-domain-containing protein [Hymenopellis radicata]
MCPNLCLSPLRRQPTQRVKAKVVIDLTGDDDDDDRPVRSRPQPIDCPDKAQLWVDLYEPTTEEELAVHKKKVEDVRGWLTEAFQGRNKYRRVLALTGPAGTAKTTTMRILARELDFEILEWGSAAGHNSSLFGNDQFSPDYDDDTLFVKFESFLARASSCQNLFTGSSSSSSRSKRQVVLLEDLPNILHNDTKTRFHDTLQSLVTSGGEYPVPLVFIISDAGLRGEASDERLATGSWGKDNNGVVDIRTVIPSNLLHGPYVTQIRFNPIAATFLKKALQALLKRHFGSSGQPTKEVLDLVVESANGDIRSAINALQFSCARQNSKKRSKTREKLTVMESVTRREQSLALFHLIGKVLYNKRKGDPPTPSASAKDIQKEKDLDAQLKDPPPLPKFLSEHKRRTSRVDVDKLYADSPIDSSLFSLYIHQNYTQFCGDIDELAGIADNLSWVDSSGGESWYQANPHRFHLLTMGTLHALPSPVERKSQKIYKPDFFENLNKEKDAWASVLDVRRWLVEKTTADPDGGWRAGAWSRNDIAMEVGGVLKARDALGASHPLRGPPSHKAFSGMRFVLANCGAGAQLGETEGDEHDASIDVDDAILVGEEDSAAKKGGWLDGDDIESFEDPDTF